MHNLEAAVEDYRQHLIAARVVKSYSDKIAKAKHLKAIDFTIGLIRRVMAMGESLPGGSNQEVLKRLIEMRKASQKGFQLGTLLDNKAMVSGKGKDILKMLEREESKVMPREKDLAEFVKPFANQSPGAVEVQADKFAKMIMAETDLTSREEVEDAIVRDAVIFDAAFAAVEPALKKAKAAADSIIGGSASGVYESRIKDPKSTFGKQVREGINPFIYFKDLVGCRVVTPTVANMAEVAAATQSSSLKILQKKNFYLQNKGYNAINYVMSLDGAVIEFQLKTSVNAIEAAISHDLIYAPEKAIIELSSADKSLVARVIDVSTQLSMREWAEVFDIMTMKYAAAMRQATR